MLKRTIGKSGIEVSALGLGCWAIGGPFNHNGNPSGWGQVDDAESIRAIHAALELGVNFLDTANVYGCGHSEKVIAQAIAGRRDQLVLATKFGNSWAEGSNDAFEQIPISPAEIRHQLEASLKRLNTDYVDLLQFHLWGYPIEDAATVRDTLENLVSEGKIRGYGWSTDRLEAVQLFAEGPNCIAVQQQLNLLHGHSTGESDAIIAFCEAHNLASINRAPLAMGLLTGKFTPSTSFSSDDVRSKVEWFEGFQAGKPNPEWLKKLEALREVLTSEGRSLTQGALAWLWGRSSQTLPIPGFRTVAQASENAKALQFGPLTASQMQQIDSIVQR